LSTPTEWDAVKQIMEHFKVLYLPFPVRTFCETKATVYLSRPLRADKLRMLACEHMSVCLRGKRWLPWVCRYPVNKNFAGQPDERHVPRQAISHAGQSGGRWPYAKETCQSSRA
jgi:hypothetical protein